MFNIGDKIVYPVQGVGIIDLIEEKEFQGELQPYYKIHLISNSLRVMLPSKRLFDSNIRLISDSNTLDKVLSSISSLTTKLEELTASTCKERIFNNTNKIKSGTLVDYVEVISNLTNLKKQHTLNASESQMLKSTRKLLIDEISLIKDITNTEASDLLDFSLDSSFELAQ